MEPPWLDTGADLQEPDAFVLWNVTWNDLDSWILRPGSGLPEQLPLFRPVFHREKWGIWSIFQGESLYFDCTAFPVYEKEISQVDDEAGGLSDDEYGVISEDGVEEQESAAGDAQQPERHGDYTATCPLTGNPLDEKPRREQRLSQEPQSEQPIFHKQTFCGVGEAVREGSFALGLVTSGSSSSQFDAVFLDLVMNGPPTDAQQFRGVLLHPACLLQSPRDGIAFTFFQ